MLGMTIVGYRLTIENELLPLDETSLPSVASISKFALHRADLEFHEEWLRDEPCEATTTGSGSSIPVARCQLSPGNYGEHEIRGADFFCIS